MYLRRMNLIVLAGLLCTNYVFCQSDYYNPDIFIGENFYNPSVTPFNFEVLATTESGTTIYKGHEFEKFLEIIDNYGNVATSIALDEKTFKENKVIADDIFYLSGKIYVRSFVFVSNENKLYEILDEYDATNLSLNRNVYSKEFIPTDFDKGTWYGKDIRRGIKSMGKHAMVVSENEEFIVDYVYNTYISRKTSATLKFTLYDKSFNELFNKTFEIPYPSAEYNFKSVAINNLGDVFLMGVKISTEKPVSKSEKRNNDLHIFHFSKGKENVQTLISTLEKLHIGRTGMTFDNSNNLVVYGYYDKSNSEDYDWSTEGGFTQKFDINSGQIISTNIEEFSNALILSGLPETERKKIENDSQKNLDLNIKYCEIQGTIKHSKDRMIVIGEPGPYSEIKFPNKVENIIFEFNDAGDITKTYLIPIEHTTIRSEYYTMCDDNLVYLYQINDKNADWAYNSNLIMITVTPSGDQHRQLLKTNGSEDLLPHFIPTKRIENCKMLMYFTAKVYLKYKFGALTISK